MKNRCYILPKRRRQAGVTLFMVLVIMLLSLTAVLGAFRVANLNESLLGNTSDYNLTYAAAEALIRDAEVDIRGRRPPYTTVQPDQSLGFPCRPNPPDDPLTNVSELGFEGSCRPVLGVEPWFPRNSHEEFDTVSDMVGLANPNRCVNGICVPLNDMSHANIESNLGVFLPLGATYGQFTRNALGGPGAAGNPVLNNGNSRYWIEVFRYNMTPPPGRNVNASSEPADLKKNLIYRITAIAQGRKPGTRVVLKTFFVPNPRGVIPP